jgi:Ca-activated chloride channel homolog
MKRTILITLPILIALAAFTITMIVTGTVTDEQGKPIPFATVTIKGKAKGVSADAYGKYSINANVGDVLVFSSQGRVAKEVTVGPKGTVDVVLVSNNDKELREVVITRGYGTKRTRRQVVTNSATVSNKALYFTAPSGSLNDALAGKVSGVQVQGQSQIAQGRNSKLKSRRDAFNTEDYDNIVENTFHKVSDDPLSTFSIDVDAASYSNVRRYISEGQMPPAGAVRIEEMINYFRYNYPQPTGKDPFSITTEMSDCPWNSKHKLVLIGLQGKKIPTDDLPPSNLVFLIDVSGSMFDENKLPLVKASLKMLTDQLREKDRISIVVYAGNAGLVLPTTSGSDKIKIKSAIDALEAGGSTAGGAGIQLAYKTAKQNFMKNGNNRVILCTDGDFNVGVSSDDDLVRIIEKERESGVYLTVLGYGMGNYKDNKMQQLADKGNGNHAYIDGINEAKKVLVNEFGGTLFTIAKDVKLQLEFNPAKVAGYRLIGYENRMLNKEDFNDDKKDAGELGSGHTVTALYEIIPFGVQSDLLKDVDKLKYQNPNKEEPTVFSDELLTVKFRYKSPDKNTSELIVHPLTDKAVSFNSTSDNFRFAAAVAGFGMLLRNSKFKGSATYSYMYNIASGALGNDKEGYRKEFIGLVKQAAGLSNNSDDQSFNDD